MKEVWDLSTPCSHLCSCLLQTPPACSVGAVAVSRAGAPRCSTQLPLAVPQCFPKHFVWKISYFPSSPFATYPCVWHINNESVLFLFWYLILTISCRESAVSQYLTAVKERKQAEIHLCSKFQRQSQKLSSAVLEPNHTSCWKCLPLCKSR